MSVAIDIQRAVLGERERCAQTIQIYPLAGFFYDEQHISIEEILRYRDTLSQAILKAAPGERIS